MPVFAFRPFAPEWHSQAGVALKIYTACESHDATKASGFCLLWRGREPLQNEIIKSREERGGKKGREGEREGKKGKIRDGVEGERGWKGSEEESKRLVRVWWFWGNPPPRRLLTQGVRDTRSQSFCGAVQLLRSSFFVDFTCKQQCILIPGETYSALILLVEGDFSHHLSIQKWSQLWLGCRKIG